MLQLQNMHPTHLEKIEKYSPLSELNTQRFRCAEFESIDWKTSYAMIGCSHVFGDTRFYSLYINATYRHLLCKSRS